MQKRTREKIALVLFVLLVAFAGVVLTSYFTTGRSWSIAASFVDDTMGRMDGYTAIVYAGVVEPEPEPEKVVAAGPAEPAASADAGEAAGGAAGAAADPEGAAAGGATDPANDPSPDAAGAPAESPEGSAGSDSAAGDSGAADPEGSSIPVPDPPGFSIVFPDRSAEAAKDEPPSAADSIGLGILSIVPRPVEEGEEAVYASDVCRLYEDKGAHALTLNVADADYYADLQVFYVNGKRVGVYSINTYTNSVRLKRYLAYFDSRDVDVVVCLTPRASYLATYEGTDVVIVTTDSEGISVDGETRDGTLVTRSPEKGQVGVVLLSSNNVPSARVITSL
ncbi:MULTISPECIES: hypothetical protein [unclassified Adlercreutzia]|uniref:hypothetical protein n=1 Tax=unclassified Adlercreutzia TaxID=2636013 RepID=UPI0013EB2C1F|nr:MULTISPECIES: hypothetical protein [unclassified Adlercreutzia]